MSSRAASDSFSPEVELLSRLLAKNRTFDTAPKQNRGRTEDMKQLLAILGLISVAAVLSGTALAESNDADKQAIAALEQGIVKGAEAKDAKAILANFADGDSLIVFDVIPPRECRGRDAYLKNWQSALDGCADHPKMTIDDLVI